MFTPAVITLCFSFCVRSIFSGPQLSPSATVQEKKDCFTCCSQEIEVKIKSKRINTYSPKGTLIDKPNVFAAYQYYTVVPDTIKFLWSRFFFLVLNWMRKFNKIISNVTLTQSMLYGAVYDTKFHCHWKMDCWPYLCFQIVIILLCACKCLQA